MPDRLPSPETLDAIVPISRFNKGEANRIFEEVRQSGFKIVVKNNSPACVLIEPGQYRRLMEKLEDAELALEADNRMKAADSGSFISEARLFEKLGICESEIGISGEAEL